MTLNEFRAAFSALALAIQYPVPRKLQVQDSAKSYGKGTGAKTEHLIELSRMSLQDIYSLRLELEQQDE